MTERRLVGLVTSPVAMAALIAAVALLVALAARAAGPIALLLPLIAGIGLLAVERPKALVAFTVSTFVLVEDSDTWQLDLGRRQLYDPVFASIEPGEALVALAAIAVVLERSRSREALRTRPFTVPLLLFSVALVVGAFVGLTEGAAVPSQLRSAVLVVVVPVVVAGVLHTVDDLRAAIALAGALAAAKAVLGLLAAFGGFTLSEGGLPLTYLDPLANFVLVGFLLGILAAATARISLPAWAWAAAPLALATLGLSLRRSFYLALAVGAIVTVTVALGARGRHVVLPVLAVLVVGVWLTVSGGISGELRTTGAAPIVSRIQTLDPDRLRANPQDRYRLAERRNVVADILEHPFAGKGIGVPWTLRTGLPAENAGTRHYVHFAVLWWWLRTGVVGALAYLGLLGALMWAGLRVGRSHPDELVRLGGFTATGLAVGFAVVETTATFTGISLRMTTGLGAVIGFVAAAFSQTSSRPPSGGTLAP